MEQHFYHSLETTKKEKLRFFRIRESELPVYLCIELFDTFQLYQWFNLNSDPFLHTFNARMNDAFPSRRMRDCELAHSFCFWKPYKHTRKMAKVLFFETIPHFYWKKDKGVKPAHKNGIQPAFCGDFIK